MDGLEFVHTAFGDLFHRTYIVLARPEEPRNIGSVARAIANMGFMTTLHIVGAPHLITSEAIRLACHAKNRLENAEFSESLNQALEKISPILGVAVTARSGSAGRPHPIWLPEAVPRIIEKFNAGTAGSIALVFGPESDGLSNEEVAACDWIVSIPSDAAYRSLNLAQAVLIVCYELRRQVLLRPRRMGERHWGQKQRLIDHILKVAETSGFILPGDPYKMKPRLEEIFSELPNHVKDIKTLHGLLDQIVRSIQKGEPDYKGRYRARLTEKREEL